MNRVKKDWGLGVVRVVKMKKVVRGGNRGVGVGVGIWRGGGEGVMGRVRLGV